MWQNEPLILLRRKNKENTFDLFEYKLLPKVGTKDNTKLDDAGFQIVFSESNNDNEKQKTEQSEKTVQWKNVLDSYWSYQSHL